MVLNTTTCWSLARIRALVALLYGLCAAVGWGLADYVAALVARRVGTYRTVLGMQLSSLVLLALGLALTGNLPAPSGEAALGALVLGSLGSVAIAALYRALAIGPIAIVSPIVAANAAVTVVLAVALLDESLSGLQILAISATIGGVVLASTDLREVRATMGRPTPAVALALVSLVGFGVVGLILAVLARSFGPLGMTFLLRVGSSAFVLAFGALRPGLLRGLPLPLLALVVLVGILDTGGNIAFGLGATSGYASIVSTGSSAYPLIPFALGLAILRERVAPNQLAGVALLVAGLVTLGASG